MEIEKISWCPWCQEKWGRSANKTVYAKGTFLWWGLCIPRFRAIACIIHKQSGKIPSLARIVCQVLKLQQMYVVILILLSVLKTSKHTGLYSATHYCTRLQQVKERIALGSVGIFSFLIVILNDSSLLYFLNFNLWCVILLRVILYLVNGSWNLIWARGWG